MLLTLAGKGRRENSKNYIQIFSQNIMAVVMRHENRN